MSRALLTGISGLRTHQQKLDVVANNLANMNTVGFKSQATTFSDLMYNTTRGGTRATETNGGVNPLTVGSGVQMAQISRNFSQGNLQSTGQLLDFAVQGDGFFVLQDPSGSSFFSRDGSFSLDSLGRLVDPATGMFVQRFGSLGEPGSTEGGFQVAGDNSIRIPLGASVPGQATQNLSFLGNLPSGSRPPTAEVLASNLPFETTTGPATSATLLNDLTINQTDYVAGDTIEITGTNPDGFPFTASIPADTATLGDVVNELNNQLDGATASLGADGTLLIVADNPGDAFLSATIADVAGNVGSSDFGSNSMVVRTPGSDGDNFDLTMEFFDARGQSHRLTLEYQKRGVDSWDVVASLDPESGVMLDASVFNVTFNEDGTYFAAGTGGVGDSNLEIQLNDSSELLTLNLDFTNVSHMATGFSMTQTQDGFPPGTLSSINMSEDGRIDGLATNGRSLPLAQLALASFTNQGGLNAVGGNFFQESSSSGEVRIGTALTGGRGRLVGGQLEGSNVDIALEFTQLIVAQRGFSANARTITVSDEVLEELTNIIR